MDLIPSEELKPSLSLNFAPMIDFLFLMLALFATLAISRADLFDAELNLAEIKGKNAASMTPKQTHQIHIGISPDGGLKWLSKFQDHSMEGIDAVQKELLRQYEIGALPTDKEQTEVLLHIDKKASWEKIAETIFGIKEAGFSAHPVYSSN